MSRTAFLPRTMMKATLAAGLIAATASGMTVPANADAGPTGPSDPKCIQDPANPVCAGGPYAPPAPPAAAGPPTGPLDPACMTNPADAACAGSPYLPSQPPPVDPSAPFDTYTLGPHIDDMPPIDDTPHIPVMPHIPTAPHIGGGMGMPGHI